MEKAFKQGFSSQVIIYDFSISNYLEQLPTKFDPLGPKSLKWKYFQFDCDLTVDEYLEWILLLDRGQKTNVL